MKYVRIKCADKDRKEGSFQQSHRNQIIVDYFEIVFTLSPIISFKKIQ